jgi:hypothetical protein
MTLDVSTRLAWTVAVLAAVGCGEPHGQLEPVAGPPSSPAPAAGESANARTASPRPSSAAAAVPLSDPFPLLDKGRLEIAKPEEWVLSPRGREWLIRFQLQTGLAYPTILVTAEDDSEMDELSSENVRQFAFRTQAGVEAELAPQGLSLANNVQPVTIGGRSWVEYARRAKSGQERLERLFLVTVAGGRRYTLELRVREGTLAAFRPAVVAVAGSIKTHSPDLPNDSGSAEGGPAIPASPP